MTTLWLSGWEMGCCGEPFRIGDRITWTVGPAGFDPLDPLLPAADRVPVDGLIDLHSQTTDPVEQDVRVRRIRVLAAGSGSLVDVVEVPADVVDLDHAGYLVDVDLIGR